MVTLSNSSAGRSLFAGFALAVIALAATGCSEEVAEAPEVIRPVKVVEVTAMSQGRKLEYSGSVKARYEVNLAFRVDGKIIERVVDIGQRVRPGDLLARVDASDYNLSVRSAEAALQSANSQVATLRIAKSRAEQLFAKNAASKSELEERTLSYDQAVSTQQSAISALEQAKNQVTYTQLRSDVTGIVTEVAGEPGQVVGSGTPVVKVAIDGEKEVQVAVPETDIAQFQTGMRVKARFWSNDALLLDGTVREVAGSADPQSRTFSVRVSLPDDPRVLLGMTATINAVTDGSADGYEIPLAALSKEGDAPTVWVVDRAAGTVHPRPVTLASFSGDGVLVTSGLQKGDTIVTAGTQFMKAGMKVRVAGPESLRTAKAEGPEPVVVR